MSDLTEITFILDRSGSMKSFGDEAVGAYNAFVDGQRNVPGEASLNLILFDHEYLVHYSAKPVKTVLPFRTLDYRPRGTTALYDAIGKTIEKIRARNASIPEAQVPKTVITILTDGLENASQEYTQETCRRAIAQAIAAGWQFIFLGANINATVVGTRFGIPRENTVTFTADRAGIRRVLEATTAAVRAYRVGDKDYTEKLSQGGSWGGVLPE